MAPELDMSQYTGLFLQEADEQLHILEQELLALERDPSGDRLNTIFRAAHTLKGSSRAMGFSNFAEVTHQLENMLDRLRAGQQHVTTAIMDALLRTSDTLSTLKESIANGKGDSRDCTKLLIELASLQVDEEPEQSSSSRSGDGLDDLTAELLQKVQSQAPVFHASFRLVKDCVMKFARAFMAITVVQEFGELLVSLPNTADIEEENFGLEFQLYFQSEEPIERFIKSFRGISEVETFEVRPFEFSTPAVADLGTAVGNLATTKSPPKGSAPVTATPEKKAESNQTVRVDVTRLDELMNLVGELVIDRTRLSQIGANLAAKSREDENIGALAETVGHIARITADLQDQLMKTRMLPIDVVFNRFPRMVRVLAQKIGKEVNLVIQGGETELDRSVIESIGDPLLHILRNAIDHGLEMPDEREAKGKPRQGTVTLVARHRDSHIVIEISDDGGGISVDRVRAKAVEKGMLTPESAQKLSDREALNLIFASGLSTASQVTELSGRGVGMDIVRANIQKLSGIIEVDSTPGVGSTFTLRLPLTLAIIRGLLVKDAESIYVLPLSSVIETLKVEEKAVQLVHQQEAIILRGATLPLLPLKQVLVPREKYTQQEVAHRYVVVVGIAEQRIGIVVDSLVGEQEVVIKSLNRHCGDVAGVSGATILGDGNVALIVDVNGVIQKSLRERKWTN